MQIGAKDGTLAIMVGGDERAVRKVFPLLNRLGTEIFHVGPLGAGHAVKALDNYLGAAGTLAGFEALLIAQAFGLDLKPMLEAINASTGRNSTTVRKIPQDILTGAYASGSSSRFLKETLKHWKAAQRHLSRDSDHTEIYKYQKKLTRR